MNLRPTTKPQAILLPVALGTLTAVGLETALWAIGLEHSMILPRAFLLSSIAFMFIIGAAEYATSTYETFLKEKNGEAKSAKILAAGFIAFETLVYGAILTAVLYFASFISGISIIQPFWKILLGSFAFMLVYECGGNYISWVLSKGEENAE